MERYEPRRMTVLTITMIDDWEDRFGLAPASHRYQCWCGDIDLGVTIGSGPTPEEALQDLADALDVDVTEFVVTKEKL